MQNKVDEYHNPDIRKALTKFKENFPIYREIRGDGNCFYRAFYISYFENKILFGNNHFRIFNHLFCFKLL